MGAILYLLLNNGSLKSLISQFVNQNITIMALIKCPKCGKEFSDRAKVCPQCGEPTELILQRININKKTQENLDKEVMKRSFIAIVSVVILGIIFLICILASV